eukprot:scaffold2535_cov336-Prasinococcus_capsulatus_cf.AAC.8
MSVRMTRMRSRRRRHRPWPKREGCDRPEHGSCCAGRPPHSAISSRCRGSRADVRISRVLGRLSRMCEPISKLTWQARAGARPRHLQGEPCGNERLAHQQFKLQFRLQQSQEGSGASDVGP